MDKASTPEPSLVEGIVRTLRHEIGDFLQTVYSTAAILQARLPAGPSLERNVVTNLRARAEVCKHLLDTVHDVVFPISLSIESVQPAEVATQLATRLSARYPHLDLRDEADENPTIQADPQRLLLVGNWLVENACQSAASVVRIHTASGPAPGEVTWTVSDDGPGLSPEQMAHLFDTFTLSRRGTLGLGLGPVRKVVDQHGGRVEAANRPGGGLLVRVVLPTESVENPT